VVKKSGPKKTPAGVAGVEGEEKSSNENVTTSFFCRLF
jgi:hypothetical protein